jgi:hypothetical protein
MTIMKLTAHAPNTVTGFTSLSLRHRSGDRTVSGFESLLAAIVDGHDGSAELQHVAAELLVAIPLHRVCSSTTRSASSSGTCR